VLTLVGRSPRCHVRLPDPGASRFVCALVRTPVGVWVVDLLSSRGVVVNGVACREARLEDGDVLRMGARAARLLYEGATPARGGRDGTSLPPALIDPPAGPAVGDLSPELILRPLLEQGGPFPEPTGSPFGQALMMLIRLLGDVHRDHLGLVREELEQIRRLSVEVRTLRAQLARPDPGALQAGAPAEGPDPAGNDRPPVEDEPGAAPTERPDPQLIQAIVGERIAAWERERQSRWRKVLDLLVNR
jgi:hypothetical protein